MKARAAFASRQIATAAALLAPAAAPAAGPVRAQLAQLHRQAPASVCGTAGAEVGAPNAVAVSPDGRSVYTATSGGAIGRFDRDPTSGVLAAAGCFADVSLTNCGGVENRAAGLLGAFGVAVSPDGASVYVASGTLTSGAIVRFDRDPATGALTPRGCIQYTGGTDCVETTAGLHGATSVAVSRDGRSVYVTGARSDALVRFDRGGDGALTPRGCVQNTGGVDCAAVAAGLDVPESVAVSPDGRSVYVASEISSAVARFDRDPATGALTQRGCFEAPPVAVCGGDANTVAGLFGAISVAVSGDGRNVHVASRDESAVAWFVRKSSTGALTPAGCTAAERERVGSGERIGVCASTGSQLPGVSRRTGAGSTARARHHSASWPTPRPTHGRHAGRLPREPTRWWINRPGPLIRVGARLSGRARPNRARSTKPRHRRYLSVPS